MCFSINGFKEDISVTMPISNQQWRIEVGKINFATKSSVKLKSASKMGEIFVFIFALLLFCALWPVVLLITVPTVLLHSLISNFIELNLEDFILCVLIIFFKLCFLFNYAISHNADRLKSLTNPLLHYLFLLQIVVLLPHLSMLLIMCGDVESNPGPNNISLNLCHWNLNGLAAHNFVKLTHLNALSALHNFDIICVSETFLDSDFLEDDSRLDLQGYEMIRCDFPGNSKRGGVCVYYREDLPLKPRYDLSNLDQCLILEIRVKRSKCFVTCVYRSPNDSDDEEDQFCRKFESTCSNIALENPIASFILGDINAKSANWWEPGGSNSCGLVIEDISNAFNYTQLIKEPTNFDPGK